MAKTKSAVGTCPDCGKLRFLTRKSARAHLRKRKYKEHVSVYPCGEFYHFGHTPYVIRKGYVDRREWTDEQASS